MEFGRDEKRGRFMDGAGPGIMFDRDLEHMAMERRLEFERGPMGGGPMGGFGFEGPMGGPMGGGPMIDWQMGGMPGMEHRFPLEMEMLPPEDGMGQGGMWPGPGAPSNGNIPNGVPGGPQFEHVMKYGTEVFCGGLERSVKEEDLHKFFESVGDVQLVRLAFEKEGGKANRGFAFVRFGTKRACEKALEKNLKELKGKRVNVVRAADNDTLVIFGLDLMWKEDALREVLAPRMTQLVKIDLMRLQGDDLDRNRGYALIQYENHQAASSNLKRSGGKYILEGRECFLTWADPNPDPDEEMMRDVKHLFVSHIDERASEKELDQLFGKVGRLERISLSRNMPNARRKDFAFVHYKHRSAALQAIKELDGVKFYGLNLKVELAKPFELMAKQFRELQEQQGAELVPIMQPTPGPIGPQGPQLMEGPGMLQMLSPEQMGMGNIGMEQMGMGNMGMEQIGMGNIGMDQMGMGNMGMNQMGMGMGGLERLPNIIPLSQDNLNPLGQGGFVGGGDMGPFGGMGPQLGGGGGVVPPINIDQIITEVSTRERMEYEARLDILRKEMEAQKLLEVQKAVEEKVAQQVLLQQEMQQQMARQMQEQMVKLEKMQQEMQTKQLEVDTKLLELGNQELQIKELKKLTEQELANQQSITSMMAYEAQMQRRQAALQAQQQLLSNVTNTAAQMNANQNLAMMHQAGASATQAGLGTSVGNSAAELSAKEHAVAQAKAAAIAAQSSGAVGATAAGMSGGWPKDMARPKQVEGLASQGQAHPQVQARQDDQTLQRMQYMQQQYSSMSAQQGQAEANAGAAGTPQSYQNAAQQQAYNSSQAGYGTQQPGYGAGYGQQANQYGGGGQANWSSGTAY